MKTKLLFFCTLFLCTNLSAQDWQLFNTNYITYYRTSAYSNIVNEKIDKIYEFQFDKEKISENNFLFTSVRIKPKNYYDSCLFTIRQQYKGKVFGEDGYLIDMYKIINDTLYCYDEIFGKLRVKNYKYILPLNMDKNDSLVKDKLKLKFVESKIVKVLEGLYDSAKVYSIENMELIEHTFSNITLTQHYGIMDHLFDDDLKLCGLKKLDGSESFGNILQKCNISNLLNLKVGDCKIWKTEIFEMGKNDEVYYSKDICKSVTFNEDSIIVEFERTEYKEEKPWKIFGAKETYVKTLWDEMIANRQNTTHFINRPPNGKDNIMGISIVEGAGYLVFQDSNMNTSGSMVEYTDKAEFLIGECESMFYTDHNLTKIISCKLGEVYSQGGSGFGGSITSNLIGYINDDVQYGEIPYYLSINENNQPEISLSPNPASDYITLNVPPLEKSGLGGVLPPIEIFNIFGECVLTVETGLRPVSTRIDISTLSAGVYFVKIGNITEKFVKINN